MDPFIDTPSSLLSSDTEGHINESAAEELETLLSIESAALSASDALESPLEQNVATDSNAALESVAAQIEEIQVAIEKSIDDLFSDEEFSVFFEPIHSSCQQPIVNIYFSFNVDMSYNNIDVLVNL